MAKCPFAPTKTYSRTPVKGSDTDDNDNDSTTAAQSAHVRRDRGSGDWSVVDGRTPRPPTTTTVSSRVFVVNNNNNNNNNGIPNNAYTVHVVVNIITIAMTYARYEYSEISLNRGRG